MSPRHATTRFRPFPPPLLAALLFATPLFFLLAGCESSHRSGGHGSTEYLGGAAIPQPPPPGAPPYGGHGSVGVEAWETQAWETTPRLRSGQAPRFPPTSTAPAPGGVPGVVARSVIIVDAFSGQVLYEKNADTRRPVASTQKLLTALLITGSGNLDGTVTVAPGDTEVDPYKLGLAPGEVYTRRSLLRALLVRSGNDIAHCLARSYAGSEPAFAEFMNRRARSLGMLNSNFVNASGLTASGQYSTARDLAILARVALRDPSIAPSLHTRSYTFRFADGRTKLIKNTNKLLEKSPYCHGMKTGWTRASGRCLVSCGTRNGRTVIVVVLHSSWDDVWDDSRKLLHWGLGAS